MDNYNRQNLIPGDNITLKRINFKTGKTVQGDTAEFSVISVIEGGGSSICYEVCCENDGAHGRLKEFYPINFSKEDKSSVFKRSGDNQLIFSDASINDKIKFESARDDFKNAYCTLAKAKNMSYGEVLNNYIPEFELYEGYADEADQPKTVYIWTRHDKKIKPFNEYIDDVKADLNEFKQPEYHLFNILNAVMTLTKCIRALHTADLVHVDIKPSNFGVLIDEKGQIDSSSISLYDMNTIYSADSNFIKAAGTEGFRAPEVLSGQISCKSDIYSIGATLFNAIVISDDFDGVYNDAYYSEIDNLVANSKLIRYSDNNSNSALYDILVKILKKSLAYNREKRYKACSYMLEDITKAIAFLLPEKAKKALTELGKDIKIVDIEEYLDKGTSSGATGAIQKLLFEHPLYEGVNDGEVEVLVLGAGTYAQKFIDIAFEVSQIENFYLNITVISNNASADKERYLRSRPAFMNFFTVDNIVPAGEPFGTLKFMPIDGNDKNKAFSRENRSENKEIITNIMLGDETHKFSYVFIALGDDELNYEMAKECLLCNELLSNNGRVYFAWYGRPRGFEKVSPIYVNNVISESEQYKDLKRMALNCHLLWNRSLNVNIQKLKGEFSSPYNFNSSFSNILSIKYKLHSIGIDINIDDTEGCRRAAKLFEEKRTGKNRKSITNSLVRYEHRRWIVNSICRGWDVLTDYSSLIADTKDKKNKLHPCIVRSDSNRGLNLPKWKNNNHEKWDSASEAELNELDELDRTSVLLHRYFKKKAEETKSLSLMRTDINKIRNSLKFHSDALRTFDRFVTCLNEITAGKSKRTSLYTYYLKNFEKQIETLPENPASDIRKTLKIIESTFYPILQSQKYTDFKEFDRDLIVGIPFILTYSTGIRLCVPFGMEAKGESSNRILFGNVSAAVILNPSVITYVVDADDVCSNEPNFMRSLNYALNCIESRMMQAKINLLFLQSTKNQVVGSELKEKIKATSKRVGSIDVIEYDSDSGLKGKLIAYIKANQKNKKKCFSAVERNGTGVSKLMRGLGCYDEVPAYSYDSVSRIFDTDSECEFLKYVKSSDYLRVSDMFSFHNAENAASLPEMQLDYKFFWRLYKSPNPMDRTQGNEMVWKALCKILKDISETNDFILTMDVPKKDKKTKAQYEERTYYIPAFCCDAVEKIIYDLKEISTGLTGADPSIVYHNSTTCKVVLNTVPMVYEKFDELFSNPHYLYDASKIRIEKFNKSANIYFDNLRVDGLKKSLLTSAVTKSGFSERLIGVLKELNDSNYIINYKEKEYRDETYISFTYSSPQIKSIMTNEGRILELYVYYKALEQNYFDDAASGCEIIWNNDNVSNEFDVVLTKGFKSLLIECKARTQLEQDFYYKLAQLNQRFGINAVPVLVADTIEPSWYDNSVNEQQRSRGNELGIKTIYENNDINETAKEGSGIGATLRRIMENLE